MDKLVSTITPADINASGQFIGSGFRNSEKETVARNIVLICQKVGQWLSFSFADYSELCTHKVTEAEKFVLDRMVSDGELCWWKGGKYTVTNEFIGALAKFVR